MSRKISNAEIAVEEILDYEKTRYIRKGYGFFMACLIAFTWFFVMPQLARYVWPAKIENEGIFFYIFSYILHQSIFIICNLSMWVVYKLEWPFFERYKVHDKEWPWKENPEKWNELIKSTFIVLFINQIIVLPLFGIIYYIKNFSPVRVDYESLPTCFEVIWQTVFFMIMEDFTFYWSHRLLHWDVIYPYIHKIHHKHVNTVSIAAEYSHPLEYFIGNVFTTNSGVLLLGRRVHAVTFTLWIAMRIAETADGHCGYEFSWSPYRLLPMSASSEYHNHHHLNFKGNYASFFTVWDRLCNTVNEKYLQFVEKKKELLYKQKEKNKSEIQNINEKKMN
jgi:sterol desaturase/sphingolipid hydroxylase (fatty acid hydroxylase superfamily)